MESATVVANGSLDSNDSDGHGVDKCAYEIVDFERFLLIVAFGTPCAILGIITNCLLCTLLWRKHHLRTPDLYFAVLAALDVAFCVSYLLLMTVDAVGLHYGVVSLYAVYARYSYPVFAIGRIIQLSSIYMVVAATVERFFMVRKWSDSSNSGVLSPHLRFVVVVSILWVCFCLRVSTGWEYYAYVVQNDTCEDPLGRYQFKPLLASNEFYVIYNFYIMSALQIFVPFILLTILNVGIIRTLRRRLSLAKKFLFPVRYVSEVTFEKGISREKLKSATYTLVAIVTSYLISNILSTVLTFLEHTFSSVLMDEINGSKRWYTIATDLSSISTAINSFLRLPLYCICSSVIRSETLTFLRLNRYGTPLVAR